MRGRGRNSHIHYLFKQLHLVHGEAISNVSENEKETITSIKILSEHYACSEPHFQASANPGASICAP